MKRIFDVSHRYGEMETWVSAERIPELISELDDRPEDTDHDQVAVHDETGLCVSAYVDGTLTLDNAEDLEAPQRYIRGASRAEQTRVFTAFATGALEEVEALPWVTQTAPNLSLREAISALQTSCGLETEEEVETFRTGLIACLPHIEKVVADEIEGLLRAFCDAAIHKEVMVGLLHLMKVTPPDAFAQAFIAALPEVEKSAPEWMVRLVDVTTYDPARCRELVRQVRTAPDLGRSAVVRLLERAAESGVFSAADALASIVSDGSSR